MISNWNLTCIALAATFHGLAILSTVFRLWYRWYTTLMWWEDTWAIVALLADIMCLVTTWLEQPVPEAHTPSFFITGNWILSFAFPTVMWASRISILISMVRVSQPVGILKRVASGVGVAFGLMWLGLIGQRLQVCLKKHCLITRRVVITQTTTDCVADVLLTGLPVIFLRDVKLSRKRKLLILSTFSASMVINVMTVAQAVVLLRSVITSGTIVVSQVVSHIKYALALIVCNLLVIVTWAYRVFGKDEISPDDSTQTSKIKFTTVEFPQEGISESENKISTIMTKSSSWSFRDPGPDQSGISSSVIGTSGAGVA